MHQGGLLNGTIWHGLKLRFRLLRVNSMVKLIRVSINGSTREMGKRDKTPLKPKEHL